LKVENINVEIVKVELLYW